MSCSLKPDDVFRILVRTIKRFVSPPTFNVTGATIIGDIPISKERWEVDIYAILRGTCGKADCCFQSLRPSHLHSKSRTVAELAAQLHADLGACPQTPTVLASRRVKKKTSRKAKARRKGGA